MNLPVFPSPPPTKRDIYDRDQMVARLSARNQQQEHLKELEDEVAELEKQVNEMRRIKEVLRAERTRRVKQ